MDASALVAQIQAELQSVTERVLATPYLAALEAGRVSSAQLLTFAGQQHHIISSDLRSMALMVSRYGGSESRPSSSTAWRSRSRRWTRWRRSRRRWDPR